MKKILFILSGLMVANLAFAYFPPPVSRYASLSVLNKTNQSIRDTIKANTATVMTLAPNPVVPGVANFKNEGDTYARPGFELILGSNVLPNGQCIVSINASTVEVTHPADGSAGFTCHLTGKDIVELDPTN